MKAIFILCVATVLIGLPGMAWGHYPEGVTFFAFQWPPGHEPVMDGDLSEWEIVPEKYISRTEEFHEILYHLIDPYDFDITRSIVSWSEPQNRLYFAAEVFDDVHQIDRDRIQDLTTDDTFEIMIDADHSGGQYSAFLVFAEEEWKEITGAQATQYGLSVPAPKGLKSFKSYNASTWTEKPPWAEYAWKMEEAPEGGSTMFYEVSIIPFDHLNWLGPEQSQIHNLEAGEIIGLNIAFSDWDQDLEYWEGYWVLSGRSKTFVYAERFTNFLLAPVEWELFRFSAVERATWGRIKSTFRR